jgi:succinate-semialdehyde dehydrogenase/glutarate-semialdehyde dehydrogenase
VAIVERIETPSGERVRLGLKSPANLAAIGEIEVMTAADIRAACETARKAQPAWAALSVSERTHYLLRILDRIIARQDEIVDCVVAETGKTVTEARQMEVFACCDSIAYYAKRAPRFLRAENRPLHGVLRFMKKLRIFYRPLGVVGIISPWNGPVILAVNPSVQALVAGNAVILKPSEVTPLSALLVADIFREAGLPDGVFQVMTGDGSTGAALIEAGVDKISFTGSVETGKRVGVACAERLIPCTLELGGKDPMIVCADADIESAAAGAVAGSFFNAGQYCCGTERIYVVESIADAFTEAVKKRVATIRQGVEGEFDVGAMFWDRQLEIVEAHMQDAVAKGATVLAGGRRNPDLPGLFYEPTVVTDVSDDMLLMTDETFGPILTIVPVRDEEEALHRANDTRYGLSATIWSKNTEKAVELARRVESGGVCINDITMTYGCHEAPFGGLKDSGVGQVNGEQGVKGYCHTMPVIVDRFGGKQVRGTYPFTAKKDATLRKIIGFLFGSRIGRLLS